MSDDANISPKTDQAGMSAHRTGREFELKFSTDSANLPKVKVTNLALLFPVIDSAAYYCWANVYVGSRLTN
jgi:hypothetical protein